jgi:hypothetical protein
MTTPAPIMVNIPRVALPRVKILDGGFPFGRTMNEMSGFVSGKDRDPCLVQLIGHGQAIIRQLERPGEERVVAAFACRHIGRHWFLYGGQGPAPRGRCAAAHHHCGEDRGGGHEAGSGDLPPLWIP